MDLIRCISNVVRIGCKVGTCWEGWSGVGKLLRRRMACHDILSWYKSVGSRVRECWEVCDGRFVILMMRDWLMTDAWKHWDWSDAVVWYPSLSCCTCGYYLTMNHSCFRLGLLHTVRLRFQRTWVARWLFSRKTWIWFSSLARTSH